MGIGKREFLEIASSKFRPMDELIEKAFQRLNPEKIMAQAYGIMGDLFRESLLLQKEITLPGGIGKLVPKRREGYRTKRPDTGKPVDVDPCIIVRFVPSGPFRKALKLKRGKR